MGQDNPPWSAYVPPSTPSRVFRGYNAKPPYQPTYPPNSLPNPPDEPINPTGEPPELDPPPPGGIDDNWVPPDPTKLSPWDKTKFIILKIFEGIGETEIVIPFAVVPPCYNVLSVPGAQSGCA